MNEFNSDRNNDHHNTNINMNNSNNPQPPRISPFEAIKALFSFVVYILGLIHSSIMKSKHPRKIYTVLTILLVYLFNFNAINFSIYKTVNNQIYSWKIEALASEVQESNNNNNNNNESLKNMIQNDLKTNIERVILSEKDKCIKEHTYDWIQEINEHSVVLHYPSDEELEEKKNEFNANHCSVDKLPDPYFTLLDQVFGAESELVKNYKKESTSNTSSEIVSPIQNDINEIKSRIQEQESASNPVKDTGLKTVNMITEHTKSKNEIKAIFCLAGHGKGRTGAYDPGAIAANQEVTEWNGKLSEREMIMKIMPTVCKRLEKELAGKVKVYSIGMDTERTLQNRINLVNQISKENGYNVNNSIGIELHFNKVGDVRRSGAEVMYSRHKVGLSEPLAKHILHDIKSIYHENQNFMKLTNDKDSRFGNIGIVSDTVTNMILIEYGFMSSSADMKWANANIDKMQDTLVNSIKNYLN